MCGARIKPDDMFSKYFYWLFPGVSGRMTDRQTDARTDGRVSMHTSISMLRFVCYLSRSRNGHMQHIVVLATCAEHKSLIQQRRMCLSALPSHKQKLFYLFILSAHDNSSKMLLKATAFFDLILHKPSCVGS